MCGEVGLTIKQFDALSFIQFNNIATGYNNKQTKLSQERWEQTRMLMYSSLLPHAKKGVQLDTTDVMKFPWEVKHQALEQSNLTDEEKLLEVQKAKQFWQDQDKKRK